MNRQATKSARTTPDTKGTPVQPLHRAQRQDLRRHGGFVTILRQNPSAAFIAAMALFGLTVLGLLLIHGPDGILAWYALALSLKWPALLCVLIGLFTDRSRRLLAAAAGGFLIVYLSKYVVLLLLTSAPAPEGSVVGIAPAPAGHASTTVKVEAPLPAEASAPSE